MKLTTLDIQGFKSFADRTLLRFDDGVTGIVGPNGCGKSNVIDAFRWVLGEQKTSALRSEKMENIIFNGTSQRRKANVAQVSVTFENTRGLLPSEYESVKITRKYYRDGNSEYLLNEVPCRRMDIQNMLMDTGISSDSYAIIELALVEELLKDKNNARRHIFEQAAGISKFKQRKKETESRLDDTQQSLTRVEDSLGRIEKDLKRYEREAKRASKYLELRDEHRHLSIQLLLLNARQWRVDLAQLNNDLGKQNEAYARVSAQLAKTDARRAELQEDLAKKEQGLESSQKELQEFRERIRNAEHQKDLRGERLKNLQQRDKQLEKEIEEGKQSLERLTKHIDKLEDELAKVQQQHDADQQTLKETETELDGLKAEAEQAQQASRQLETAIRQHQEKFRKLERDGDHLSVKIQNLEQEKARSASDQQDQAEVIDGFAERIETLQQAHAAEETKLSELNAQRESLRGKHAELEEQAQHQQESLHATQRELDATKHNHELTKSLVESLEGFPDSIRFLSKQGKWAKTATLLSDIFLPPEDYKQALELFLEPYLNHYVVRTREEALRGIALLKEASKGRASFLLLEEIAARQAERPALPPLPAEYAERLTPMLDLLEYDSAYEPLARFLFDGVYVTANSDAPEGLRLPAGLQLIDAGGARVHREGVLAGGSVGLFSGKRVGRGKDLERLTKALKQLGSQLEEQDTALQQTRNAAEAVAEEIEALPFAEYERRRNELTQELGVVRSRQEEYQQSITKLGQRQETIDAELAQLREEQAGIAPALEAEQTALAQAEEQMETSRKHLQAKNAELSHATERFTNQRLQFGQVSNKLQNLQKDLKDAQNRYANQEQTQRRREKELDQVRDDILAIFDTNAASEEEITEQYKELRSKEQHVEAKRQAVDDTKHTLNQLDESTRTERREKEQLSETMNALRNRKTELETQLGNLSNRLDYEFGLDWQALNPQEYLPEDEESIDTAALQEQVDGLRQKLDSYGNVNTMAVEEFQRLEEEYNFITGQRDDLLSARQDLEKTMIELDRKAREQFMETFSGVRDNFQQVFTSLFSKDDRCDLFLTDPDDPLNSSIDITAQPKGKRPLSISQLSGGEKTLTAVSLLFAVYLVKPAPFCIFDEVDAPLDDANIDKFNNIIRDFSDRSQFILVTHNKRTMVNTNVMYGVTMQESGVSRVLPVNLETLELAPA